MGILEDAINEHLELKRQHGGSEEELEKLEQEALGPGGERSGIAPPAPESPQAEQEAPPEPSEEYDETTKDSESSAVEEGLAKIDSTPDAETAEARLPEPEHTSAAQAEESQGEAVETSETQKDTLDTAPADRGEDGEDILEETPEFLEETPDQDQLWFEQKPPKDFDF